MKLRVVHYPQVPCKPFTVEVKDENEALKICETLANQHLFLFDNNFIPDYCNVIIVQMYDEEYGWVDYWNEEEEMDWDEMEIYLNSQK